MPKKEESLIFFKCTRPDGTDFRTGKVNYAEACCGKPLTIDAAPANGQVCGHGFHVSPTARKTIQFAEHDIRPWRWWEVNVLPNHIVEQDAEKARVRELRVIREVSLSEIFGDDFASHIKAVKAESETWKKIPWLKPSREVT